MTLLRLRFHLLYVLAISLPTGAAWAGPLEELKGVTGLEGIEASALLKGKIISARGSQGNFLRGLYTESAYYLKAPLPTVGNNLLHSDPSKQKELEIDVFKAFTWPVPAGVFKTFQLSAARSNDRPLIEETMAAARGSAGDLHLGKGELDYLHDTLPGSPGETGVNAAWRHFLQARSEALASTGLAGQAAYQAHGVTFQAEAECKTLLGMTPGLASHFGGLTEAPWLHSGGPCTADEITPYGDQAPERSHTIFTLGLLAAKKTPGSWQVMDLTYYTTNTYFMAVTLYQIWPWENGTLVLQVDYASAPFRAGLGGLDKMFAGREMVKGAATGIGVLRRETER